MKKQELYLDKYYIPELINSIKNEHIQKRLNHELFTYANRALYYKRLFYFLTYCTVVFPAIIAIINALPNSESITLKVIITVISSLSSVAAGVLGIAHVRDNWITYRNNCEKLKAEVFEYVAESEKYRNLSVNEKEVLFISNIMKITEKEVEEWKINNASDSK